MLAIWRVWKSSKHCSGVNDMAEQHEKALVPQIRFTGFTDPWEQRKLGELTESYSGGTPAAGESEFYGGSIPFIRSAEIAAESTELFLTEKGYESSSARMVKPGDVLYALYGATSGEVAVSRQKGAINQAILAILPRDDCDARYITAWLRKQKGYIVTTYLQGGQGNLSGVIVKNLEVFIPSLPEQQKIGFMLSHLDSLITLHQRKYDKLCVLKKSMLDKMFPKGGSLYPEIRFAGFTDPWEQRKLSSTCEQLSRTINPLETPNEEFTEYSMPAFDNNETAETVIGNSMNSLRKIVDRPCLLVNKLNVRKKRIWHVPRPEANAVCSSEFVPFSSHSSDLSFIKISLLSERITAYLESCSSGSSNSQKRVTPEIIMSSEIIAPSLAEQRRIGAFFDRLDSLITLHQRKLELLRNIKKSMLDKMFV
ncbi:restriction endonuclease subunit S [Bifidobacterium adolescentis]|nr:restriction endonuclease subunit S [Bifidobacterium adolescentis]KAB5957565.1 restriction endonuclease subunit S [Bifidobacterium adolescentis]